MKNLFLSILITFFVVNIGKSQTLNIPDNIGTSSNAGKVGIGTIDPKAALHVETSGSFLRLSNNISNYFHSGIDGLGIYFEHVADSPEKSQMRFQTRNSNQGAYTQFFIDGANSRFNFINGDVGVGTKIPKAALHVETSGSFLRLSNNISNYFHSGIDGLGIYFEHVADSPEKSQMRFQTRNSNQGTYTQFFIDGANSRFTFKNGSVAIGNAGTGNHKLAVDGSIGAREIIIEAGAWSDFVFNKDYKLKDLEEVESFIEENKHLPDIPSEKEVLENGFSLGEMDAKLLQKIEELTLYMIEQNKETKKLIEKVEILESENELLKKEIGFLKTQ